MKKDIRFYELEIINSIIQIEKYLAWVPKNIFITSDEKFDACCMRLQHIWECGIKLEELTEKDYKWIPFSFMRGLRNRITHDYAWLDEEIIYNTIMHHLPELKKLLES